MKNKENIERFIWKIYTDIDGLGRCANFGKYNKNHITCSFNIKNNDKYCMICMEVSKEKEKEK